MHGKANSVIFSYATAGQSDHPNLQIRQEKVANGGASDSITVVGLATILATSSYNFKRQRLDGADGSNLQWEYVGDPTRTLQTNRGNNGIYLILSNVGESAVGLYRCKDSSTNEAEELLLTTGMCTHTYVRTCVVCVSGIVQFLVQVVAVVSTTHSYLQDIPVCIRVAHIPTGEGCSITPVQVLYFRLYINALHYIELHTFK